MGGGGGARGGQFCQCLKIKFKLHLLFYPSTWYICDFFLFHIEIEGKGEWIFFFGGGGGGGGGVGVGGAKGMLAPLQDYWGARPPLAPPAPPSPTPMQCSWLACCGFVQDMQACRLAELFIGYDLSYFNMTGVQVSSLCLTIVYIITLLFI